MNRIKLEFSNNISSPVFGGNAFKYFSDGLQDIDQQREVSAIKMRVNQNTDLFAHLVLSDDNEVLYDSGQFYDIGEWIT